MEPLLRCPPWLLLLSWFGGEALCESELCEGLEDFPGDIRGKPFDEVRFASDAVIGKLVDMVRRR
jgi:hypothetical protein